jgi:hypothetical protein
MASAVRCLLIVSGVLLGSGCYSPIKVAPVPGDVITEEIDGIPFYFPAQVERRFTLTKLTREDGSVSSRCERIVMTEMVTVPDYGKLYVIRNRGFFLGTNSLEVNLKDGVLESVNGETDPQVDELLTAVASVASAAAPLDVAPGEGEVLPDCDSGRRALD